MGKYRILGKSSWGLEGNDIECPGAGENQNVNFTVS